MKYVGEEQAKEDEGSDYLCKEKKKKKFKL